MRAGSKTVAGLYSRQLTIMPVYLSMSSVFLNVFYEGHIFCACSIPLHGHKESPVISLRSFGEITGEPIRHGEVGPLRLTHERKKFL